MGSILIFLIIFKLYFSKKIQKKSIFKKFLLFFGFFLILLFSFYSFTLNFKIEEFSLKAISDFILIRQKLTMTGFHYNILDTNFFFRIILYIFGSFIPKSSSIFELLLVSENLIMFFLFLIIIRMIFKNKIILPNFDKNFYILILYSIIMILLLSNITANYGIIARNKYNFTLILWVFLFYMNKKNTYLK